jgi:recombination protein RecT
MAVNLAQVSQNRTSIMQQINGAKGLIVPLLPSHVDFDALVARMNKHMHENTRLLDCSPTSVFWSFVHAAEIGLSVGGYSGEAYILGYGNKQNPNGPKRARMIPGYKGLIKLAYQSSLVARVDAYVIYDRDVFAIDLGREKDRVHYVPYLGGEKPGNLIAVYTQIQLSSGAVKDHVMPLWRLEEVRRRAPSGADASSPWSTDRPEMYRKTGLRHALKDAPKSTEMDRALRLGEAAENEDDEELQDLPALEEQPSGQGRAARSRQRIEQRAAQAPAALPVVAVVQTPQPGEQPATVAALSTAEPEDDFE